MTEKQRLTSPLRDGRLPNTTVQMVTNSYKINEGLCFRYLSFHVLNTGVFSSCFILVNTDISLLIIPAYVRFLLLFKMKSFSESETHWVKSMS